MLEKEVNILKHELVPEHMILNENEKKELLEKLKITEKQLPKILTNDPVVKAIGAKEGDILKIIRKSPTSGIATYYRIVVKK
ncbi:MAG: DNA-directed RNA polymerase subunit H [Candidatus Aenigmatarchaeota archaeon]